MGISHPSHLSEWQSVAGTTLIGASRDLTAAVHWHKNGGYVGDFVHSPGAGEGELDERHSI